MKKNLSKGLEKDAIPALIGEFIEHSVLRKQLVKALNDKIDSEYRSMRNKEVYDKSNWAYKQSDSLGYCRGLSELISLLTEKEKE